MEPVVVIGGGISGLATAWYLERAGIPCLVYEAAERFGGLVHTDEVEGCRVEWGPDSFIATKTAALELIRDLGLESDVIGSNDHLRVTYLWKGDRLVRFPEGMQMVSPTRLAPIARTGLIGWATKLRMALDYFRRADQTGYEDITVADLVRKHYGQEAVDYIAEPLLAGVYGGDPEELSAVSVLPKFVEYDRKLGSLTRGAVSHPSRPPGGALFRTLKGGMGQLTTVLAEKLSGRLRQGTAEQVSPAGGGWSVRFAGGQSVAAPHVVIACRTSQAAALVGGAAPGLASLLMQIPYSSALTVALGYDRQTLGNPLDGFGFLIPRKHRRLLMACTFVGTKFAHRVPEGTALLRCFLGASPDFVASEPDAALIAACRSELEAILGITAEPRFTRIARLPHSMPQYTIGHEARRKSIEKAVAALPGLHLVGNAYTGVGVPDCIRMARSTAQAIAGARHPSAAAALIQPRR